MVSVWAVLVAAFLFGALGFFWGRGRRQAELRAVEALGKDIPTLILDHERLARRAGEYLGKIDEVIGERETWRRLYNDQAAGHENAQALMMQTINSLVFRYQKKTGERPQLDPIIEMVRGEWTGAHGAEVRASRGDDGKLKLTGEVEPS